MGIYVYTLRKNTLAATDMDTGTPTKIGITKYAYKVSSGYPEYNRMVARQLASADRAREANPDLDLVTFGDPKNHDFDRAGPLPIYRVKPTMTSFYDTKAPGEQIGLLYKVGKRYELERIPE